MPHSLIAAINIRINPVLLDAGGFEITWHGFFTAVGIAAGVWLSIRLARQARLNPDEAMSIAIVSVISGIIGARVLWILEHTDQIRDFGDLFALTDGGISIYGAMIGGVLGGFIYVSIFKPTFPKWLALDVAAPGMILGQAIGRFGDFVNGEHFASQTDLPWAFRYTHPQTDGPWAVWENGETVGPWFRGALDRPGEAPVPVHPVAGGYEPLLDFLILGILLWMRRFPHRRRLALRRLCPRLRPRPRHALDHAHRRSARRRRPRRPPAHRDRHRRSRARYGRLAPAPLPHRRRLRQRRRKPPAPGTAAPRRSGAGLGR